MDMEDVLVFVDWLDGQLSTLVMHKNLLLMVVVATYDPFNLGNDFLGKGNPVSHEQCHPCHIKF